MIIRLHGGIDITPETQEEGEAMALLIRNARVLTAKEFAEELAGSWQTKANAGTDLNDKQRPILPDKIEDGVA